MQPDLKKNYIYRLCYEIICFLVPLVTTPYISRVLGADGVGKYSFTYSVVAWFMLFGALGTESYGTREISRNREDKGNCSRLFWEIEFISILTCSLCLVLWGILICTVREYKFLFLALTPFLLGTMFDISWFYVGQEKIKIFAICGSVSRIVSTILVFALVRTSDDLITYCIINSLILLGSDVLMWLNLPRFVQKIPISQISLKRHFKEICVYFVPTIASSIYYILDKTLIGVITKDPLENGYYEQAAKVISVAKAFSYFVLNSVLTARMSYLFAKEGAAAIRSRMEKSINAFLFLGFGAVFGLLGISGRMVPVFFGEGYAPVEGLIYMLLPVIILAGISNSLEYQYYVPGGKRAQSSRYIIAGAALNLILDIILIKIWGAKGAAAASILAELLLMILFLYNCEGCLGIKQLCGFSRKRIIAGLIMAFVVRTAGRIPMNGIAVLLVQLIGGGIIYLLILCILRDSFIKDIFSELSKNKKPET